MDIYKNFKQFDPHTFSRFQHQETNIAARDKGKGFSSLSRSASTNKIEVTLEELSAFFDEQVRIFYSRKSSNHKNIQKKLEEFKAKNTTHSVGAIARKAQAVLKKLNHSRSVGGVLRVINEVGFLFKGIALSNIKYPLYRAIATIHKDSTRDKEGAIAYLAYQVFSGSLLLNRRSRRNRILGIRLLRKMAPKGSKLQTLSKRLASRRGRERHFESVKEELRLLAQGFEAEIYGTYKTFDPASDEFNSFSGESRSSRTNLREKKQPRLDSNPIKDGQQGLQLREVDSGALAAPVDTISRGVVISKPSPLTGDVSPNADPGAKPSVPPTAPVGSIPTPPPPPPFKTPRAVPQQKTGSKTSANAREAQSRSSRTKTPAGRMKNPYGVNSDGVVGKVNDIIEFKDGVIIGDPKIRPEDIAKVDPKIIGGLNVKQLKALNAYYWANLTDDQQRALNSDVLRELVNELNTPGLIILNLNDKAQNSRLKLACLNKDNVVAALGQAAFPANFKKGGYFDQNRRQVLSALGYKPQTNEIVERVTMAILDTYYDKEPAKPARPQARSTQPHNRKKDTLAVWEKVFIPSEIQKPMDQARPSVMDEIKYKKAVKEYKDSNPDIFSSDEWIAHLPQEVQNKLKSARPQPRDIKAAVDYLRAHAGILLQSQWMDRLPQAMRTEKEGLQQRIRTGGLNNASEEVKAFVKIACEYKRDHPADFLEHTSQENSQESQSEESSSGSENPGQSSGSSSSKFRGKHQNAHPKSTNPDDYKQGDDISHFSEMIKSQITKRWGREDKEAKARLKAEREKQEETERLARENTQKASRASSQPGASYDTEEEGPHKFSPGSSSRQSQALQEHTTGNADGGLGKSARVNSDMSSFRPFNNNSLVPSKQLADGSIIYLSPKVSAKDMPEVSLEDIKELDVHQLLKFSPSHLAHMTREQKEALDPVMVYELANYAYGKTAEQKPVKSDIARDAKARLVYLDRELVVQKIRKGEEQFKNSLSMMARYNHKDVNIEAIQTLYQEALQEHHLPEDTPCLGMAQVNKGKLNVGRSAGRTFLEQIQNMRKDAIDPTPMSDDPKKAEGSLSEPAIVLDTPDKAIDFFNQKQRAALVSKVLESDSWKEALDKTITAINEKRKAINDELLESHPVAEYSRGKYPNLNFKPLSVDEGIQLKDRLTEGAKKDFNETYQSRMRPDVKNRYELQFEEAIQDGFAQSVLPLDADQAGQEAYYDALQQRLEPVLEGMIQQMMQQQLNGLIFGETSKLDKAKDNTLCSLNRNNGADPYNSRRQGFGGNKADEDDSEDDSEHDWED